MADLDQAHRNGGANASRFPLRFHVEPETAAETFTPLPEITMTGECQRITVNSAVPRCDVSHPAGRGHVARLTLLPLSCSGTLQPF